MQSPGQELVQLPIPEFEFEFELEFDPVAITTGFRFLFPLMPCPVKAFPSDKPTMAIAIHKPDIFIFLFIMMFLLNKYFVYNK
jgi:hypothetical protein